MTLRRKMFLQIAATIVGLLLTIAASLWGINGLRADYGIALKGYAGLRRVFEAGSHLATARTLLTQPAPDRDEALREVRTAAGRFEMTEPAEDHQSGVTGEPADGRGNDTGSDLESDRGNADLTLSGETAVTKAIDAAANQLAGPAGEPTAGEADVESVEQALGRIGDLAAEIRQRIQASQDAARTKKRTTVAAMLVVSSLVVLGTLALGIWQYRGVMGPLARLSIGVKRVARGRFSQRVEARGNDEFALLAADFNKMAEELDGLYQNLERKVAEKSRELVRSERLASVGYLAAGVAHEINNPLGIITGYAEMCLAQVKQPAVGNEETGGDVCDLSGSLRIIYEEAFRCKQIIAKLLSLSRAGDEARADVNLTAVVRQVIAMIGGLADYRQRRIEWGEGTEGRRGDRHEDTKGEAAHFVVTANEVEMKQVVLNLLMNALEASPGDAVVRVELNGDHAVVRLSVIDHGKGMTPETAQRVFEPFFTEKKGFPHNGTGLGLSITHAIVTSHGGRIWGESDGPGLGSRFSIELPAVKTGTGP